MNTLKIYQFDNPDKLENALCTVIPCSLMHWFPPSPYNRPDIDAAYRARPKNPSAVKEVSHLA
jgi:hypothetical protein